MKLNTERLMLRRFKEEDAEDVFEYLHNPVVNCFANMKLETIDDARKAAIERSKEDLYFAIVLKESNKVIGEIFAHAESTDPTENEKDSYSPCWMLNENYMLNGYMYEAVKALYDYLFGKMGARRIFTYTEDYNIPCQKLCEKLVMRQEGLFKQFVSFVNDKDGKPVYENTYQYAILKDEWICSQEDTEQPRAKKKMCKYCKPIFEVESGCYEREKIVKKKVIKIGSGDVDIALCFETGNFGKTKERRNNLAATLESESLMYEVLTEKTFARKQIEYCPFCGAKLNVSY